MGNLHPEIGSRLPTSSLVPNQNENRFGGVAVGVVFDESALFAVEANLAHNRDAQAICA